MFEIPEPISRSRIRQALGREFHIAKRRMQWLFGPQRWALSRGREEMFHEKFRHRSLILRPLSGVDLRLQHNKRRNLALAIAGMDRILIRPGETFSVWKLVGRPSRSKGYLDGLVLKQGRLACGPGGGLCQLGNLLFWIFAHSPLTITERWRHGFDVFPDQNRTIPFGAGATLAYNYIDLQVENKTPYCFSIRLWLDETHLHGVLCCDTDYRFTYAVEERHHVVKQQAWGGYSRHNQIVQIRTDDKCHVTEKLLVENHAIMMYSPLLKGF